MADLLVLILIVGFFGLCVAFVYGCDRIIGPDSEADLDDAAAVAAEGPEVGVTA